MRAPKVFGVGFHRTGTSSLGAALRELGYVVTGPKWLDEPDLRGRVVDLALAATDEFDAFEDNPWPVLYRELDRHCPGSKFVLTVRDTDEWLASVVRQFGTAETAMRRWIYGQKLSQP